MKKDNNQLVNLVVGAGITGLTAADCLIRAGKNCLLVEAEDAVGGLCKTYTIDGVPFDLGPHVFFSDPDYDVKSFTKELLKNEKMFIRPYRFAIYTKNRYWQFPINPWEVTRYPFVYKKEIIKNFFQKTSGFNADQSLERFITEKSGHSYYADLFEELIYKKTLLPGEKLHRDWWLRVERNIRNEPIQFVSPLKQGGRIERIFRKIKPWYNYPAEGYERIPRLLLERFQKTGGEIILNCGPISFQRNGDHVHAATVKGRTVFIENVVWTASVNTLNDLLGFHTQELPYIDMIIACVTFKRKVKSQRPFIYIYYPEKDIIFNRIYYPENIFDKGLPSDREGLCVELNVTEDIRKMDEKEIMEHILTGIEALGLYPKVSLRECRIFRLKNGLPVYGLNYQILLKQAYTEIHRIRNLYSIGRMGGHFFCLSPSAINQGLKIAKHILGKNISG